MEGAAASALAAAPPPSGLAALGFLPPPSGQRNQRSDATVRNGGKEGRVGTRAGMFVVRRAPTLGGEIGARKKKTDRRGDRQQQSV